MDLAARYTIQFGPYYSDLDFLLKEDLRLLHETNYYTTPLLCELNGPEKYECVLCNFSTYYKLWLRKHFKELHFQSGVEKITSALCDDDSNTFMCPVCKDVILSSLVYAKHLSSYEEQELNSTQCLYSTVRTIGPQIACDQCSFKCNTRQYFNFHVRKKHIIPGKNSPGNQCSHCSRYFRTTYTLDRHIREQHPPVENCIFNCELCPGKYISEDALARHTSSKHRSERDRLECPFCFCETKTQWSLDAHIFRRHKLGRETRGKVRSLWFHCQLCSYKSKLKELVARHMLLVHTPDEEIDWFYCGHCSYKAKIKEGLRRHILHRHGFKEHITTFRCEQCSHCASRKADLKKHIMYKHTRERRIEWFRCEHCSYGAKSRSDLKNHVLYKHTSEDNGTWFRCEQCVYKARKKIEVKRHAIRMHYRK